MKLRLPHRTAILESQLSYAERNQIIESILQEVIEFHEMSMTVEEYFRYTWEERGTKTCMDIIGYYLTKGNVEGEDREVMSHYKQKEMKHGSKRNTTFSGLTLKESINLGLIDFDDSNYN